MIDSYSFLLDSNSDVCKLGIIPHAYPEREREESINFIYLYNKFRYYF